jgi:hypothetical protein
MSYFSDQVEAIRSILSSAPSLSHVKKVYAGDFDVIAQYPAISIDLRSKTKEIMGIGGISQTITNFNLYIYSNKPSYFQALEELESLVDEVEKVLTLKENRTLNGVVQLSDLFGETEFGVTDRGGALLQTAQVQFQTKGKLGV